MAVVIRLRMLGTKHKPHFRIAVADKHTPRDGRFIEDIGFYNPAKKPPLLKVDLERAEYWIKTGAKPSATVASLIKKARKSA